MLQLYREEYRKPDVGRVALGGGKRGQSAGAAHPSYSPPEAHPSSTSASTLYHIPSSHPKSNIEKPQWRKVQQKCCLLTPLLMLTSPPLPLQLHHIQPSYHLCCPAAIFYVFLSISI